MGERVFTCTGSYGLEEVKRLLVWSLGLAPKATRNVCKATRLLLAVLAFDTCRMPITALVLQRMPITASVLQRKTTLCHGGTLRGHPA